MTHEGGATHDDPMRYLREPTHRYRVRLSSYPGKDKWIRTFEAATALGAPKAVELAVSANNYNDPESVVFDVIVEDLGEIGVEPDGTPSLLEGDLIDYFEFR